MSTRRSPTPKTSTRFKRVKTIFKNISSKFRGKSPKKYNTENQDELKKLSIDEILSIDPSEISSKLNPDKVFSTDGIKRKALHNLFAYKKVLNEIKNTSLKNKLLKYREKQINDFLFREGIRTPNSEERTEIKTQTDKMVNETNSKEKLKLLEQHTQNRVDMLQGRKPTYTFSREQEQFIKKEALNEENPMYSKKTRNSNTRKGGKGKPTSPQKMHVVKSKTNRKSKPVIKVVDEYHAKDSTGNTRKNMIEIKQNHRTGQTTYHKDITVHNSEMDNLEKLFGKL